VVGRGHPKKLLYSGLVVVAAFLVAAILQRVIMGKYAIKAGVFEVGALGDTTEATAALDRRVIALEVRQAASLKPVAASIQKLGTASENDD
jgi:hypothetical protein